MESIATVRTRTPYAVSDAPRRHRAKGWLAEEITPVRVPNESIAVSDDEHPRPKITLEQLAKLKPLLGTDSTITAGNASGINDVPAHYYWRRLRR
jgi:acetyl-CoA acetyltransferase